MKIVIDNYIYNDVRNLNFAPEVDITGNEIVVNYFSVDIVTKRDIKTERNVLLYDDAGTLWAKYWITESQRTSSEIVRIEAQSFLCFLKNKIVVQKMYEDEPVMSILENLAGSHINDFYVYHEFSLLTISGYCPKQTAKERLQWVCFCIGAYVKSFFSDQIEILPISDTVTIIPEEKTYWRPSVTYNNYVTAISVTSYSYTQGTPQTTDEWVKVSGNYYIETSQEFVFTDPDVPSGASENIISIDKVTIVNDDNVNDILSTLLTYCLNRIEVDAEIINNGEYLPGDKVTVSLYDDVQVTGYIKSASFDFGKQTKSKIKLAQANLTGTAKLTIKRMYGDTLLKKNTYRFPVGYQYAIDNMYIDKTKSGCRYVYRPQNEKATGTMAAGNNTNTQQYDVALKYKDKQLVIYSVDDVEQSGDTVRIK